MYCRPSKTSLRSFHLYAASIPLSLSVMASLGSSPTRPNIKFRVLIIGRANAGKTTILQRVCDTTKNPKVYRIEGTSRTEVVRSHILSLSSSKNSARLHSETLIRFGRVYLSMAITDSIPIQRGEHNVNDELIFENNEGYIFHTSRGFESGSQDELVTVQDFVRKKAGEKRLKDRLHAIWLVIS